MSTESIEIETIIEAPRDTVWRAVRIEAFLAHWLGDRDPQAMKMIAATDRERVSWLWRDAATGEDSVLTFELEALADRRTQLRVSQAPVTVFANDNGPVPILAAA